MRCIDTLIEFSVQGKRLRGLQHGSAALGLLAPAVLRRGHLACHAMDVAVGHEPEPLQDEAVALETAHVHVGEEGRRDAGKRDRCMYEAVLPGAVTGNGGDALADVDPPPLSRPTSSCSR